MLPENPVGETALNVLDHPLEICSCKPKTGWFRDGTCRTDPSDFGLHTICCEMTESFLNYSRALGNDLIKPSPHNHFPGLKAGDRWCICAMRWKQAYEDGFAPLVVLGSTEKSSLDVVPLEILKEHSLQNNN